MRDHMGRNQLSENLLISRVCLEYAVHEPLIHYLGEPHCFRKRFRGLADQDRLLVWALGAFRLSFRPRRRYGREPLLRVSWTKFS